MYGELSLYTSCLLSRKGHIIKTCILVTNKQTAARPSRATAVHSSGQQRKYDLSALSSCERSGDKSEFTTAILSDKKRNSMQILPWSRYFLGQYCEEGNSTHKDCQQRAHVRQSARYVFENFERLNSNRDMVIVNFVTFPSF